jgi:hypothetical protein
MVSDMRLCPLRVIPENRFIASLRLRGGSSYQKLNAVNHTVLDDDYEFRNDGHGAIIYIPDQIANFDRAIDIALSRAKESVSILKPLVYLERGSYLLERKYKEVAVSLNGWQYINYHPAIYLNGRKYVFSKDMSPRSSYIYSPSIHLHAAPHLLFIEPTGDGEDRQQ